MNKYTIVTCVCLQTLFYYRRIENGENILTIVNSNKFLTGEELIKGDDGSFSIKSLEVKTVGELADYINSLPRNRELSMSYDGEGSYSDVVKINYK